MRVLFASLGAFGHLYPLMPLALICSDAGHEVVIATADPFLGRLPLPTVPVHPSDLTLASVEQETRRRHPEAHGEDFAIEIFADVTAEAVARTLIDQIGRYEPDLVIYEAMNTGAGVAASICGVPAAAYAITLGTSFYEVLHRATVGHQRDEWLQGGQTPPTGSFLAAAVLDPRPGMLRVAGDLPSAIPIRPIAYSEPGATVPAWLTEYRRRPRVYVTLGTVSFGAVEVLRNAVLETARLNVDILVAIGPEGDPTALGNLPENVHLERFVAQSKVLPLVDLIVHHGGTGTVLGSLEAGLPQLIIPQGADQFYNAELLSKVGAARALHRDDYRPGLITGQVDDLLGDVPERNLARQLSSEVRSQPSPAETIPLLIELTKR